MHAKMAMGLALAFRLTAFPSMLEAFLSGHFHHRLTTLDAQQKLAILQMVYSALGQHAVATGSALKGWMDENDGLTTFRL